MSIFDFFLKKKSANSGKNLLSFNVINVDDPGIADPYFVALELRNKEGFIDFIRNTQPDIDVAEYSDQELTHVFTYLYSQKWIIENLKRPFFVETHDITPDGNIKSERAWNQAFANAAMRIGFPVHPNSEEELMSLYMNYVYGVRLMEEMEASLDSDPSSTAHPTLSNPNNKFKG